MMHDYVLYGHHLRASISLRGLIPAEHAASPDVEIYFQDAPLEGASWFVIVHAQDPGTASFTRSVWRSPHGVYHRILFEDDVGQTTYTISPDGSQIWVASLGRFVLEEIVSCLLTQIIARALRLQGVLCLHAGVVGIGDAAIAIVGPRGMGKSTTTAALAHRGYPVLADDMAVLSIAEDTVTVAPGLPKLRLRPDAAAYLYTDAVPSLWGRQEQRVDKRQLDLKRYGLGFAAQLLPLAAIYLLEADETADAPAVIPLETAAAFSHLALHPYLSDVLDATGRAREFMSMGQLVRSVPVKRLRRPTSLDALPEICDAIVEDVHALSAST